MSELPSFWEIRESKDYPGRCYYFNTVTRVSQWTHPGDKKPRFVYVCHIIKKHAESVNPVGRNGPIKRSKEEARRELERIRERISADLSKFGEIANEESDTKDNTANGVLGWVAKSDLPMKLSAVMTLGVGELSAVIESPLGFHLFLRLE